MAVALGTGLMACSDDSDSNGSVPVYHDGDSITVDNGQEFVIELEANPGTGYAWDAGQESQRDARVERTGVVAGRGPRHARHAAHDVQGRQDRQQHPRARVRAELRRWRTAGEDRQLRRDGSVSVGGAACRSCRRRASPRAPGAPGPRCPRSGPRSPRCRAARPGPGLADERDRLVPVRLEVGEPRPQRERVVLAQALHVPDLEAPCAEWRSRPSRPRAARRRGTRTSR